MSGDTRKTLIIWGKERHGEYLTAAILSIEGYERIDPQQPQGGADGVKDLVFYHKNIKFIAGCFFPNDSNKKSFSDVKSKFQKDLKGVSKNGAGGFVFSTNVKITVGERKLLTKLANQAKCYECDIFHLERIKGILDSPAGYGCREQYLGISMSQAERVSHLTHLSKHAFPKMTAKIKAKIDEANKNLKSLEVEMKAHQKTAKKMIKQEMEKVVRAGVKQGENMANLKKRKRR